MKRISTAGGPPVRRCARGSRRTIKGTLAGLWLVALFSGAANLLAIDGSATAKTPGKTYCFHRTCHRVKTISETRRDVGRRQHVIASFYDDCRRDRYNPCGLTSSGERYRAHAPDNAASPIYPDGTKLLVWNPLNGKTLIVRINNAGPYWRKRTLDLSRAAAQKLGFYHRGIARLQVKVLAAPKRREARYRRNRRYAPVPGYIGRHATIDGATRVASLMIDTPDVPRRVFAALEPGPQTLREALARSPLAWLDRSEMRRVERRLRRAARHTRGRSVAASRNEATPPPPVAKSGLRPASQERIVVAFDAAAMILDYAPSPLSKTRSRKTRLRKKLRLAKLSKRQKSSRRKRVRRPLGRKQRRLTKPRRKDLRTAKLRSKTPRSLRPSAKARRGEAPRNRTLRTTRPKNVQASNRQKHGHSSRVTGRRASKTPASLKTLSSRRATSSRKAASSHHATSSQERRTRRNAARQQKTGVGSGQRKSAKKVRTLRKRRPGGRKPTTAVTAKRSTKKTGQSARRTTTKVPAKRAIGARRSLRPKLKSRGKRRPAPRVVRTGRRTAVTRGTRG
ncbi:MAG: septal ring lytic transglycosylase RlpA family protein [Hyphomicrobiaceae bacterium]